MEVRKIVITGGPCAGKTTALERIADTFTRLGYRVIFVPETATELIPTGVTPRTCGSPFEYQRCQMTLHRTKEEVYNYAVSTMPVDKVLMVWDRGLMDNQAYVSPEEFRILVDEIFDGEDLNKRYEAVFHLVTAAKGAEEFYTTSNNSARTETVEEAAALDDRLFDCWKDHPYHRIIDNSGDFDHKMNRLISEIALFLGETLPEDKDSEGSPE